MPLLKPQDVSGTYTPGFMASSSHQETQDILSNVISDLIDLIDTDREAHCVDCNPYQIYRTPFLKV